MPWFKVDDGFYDHPKVLALRTSPGGSDALALWLLAGTWSSKHLTDGHIPKGVLPVLGGPESAGTLVRHGFWDAVEDGYKFHDWADYQPTKIAVLRARESTSKRVRRYRKNERSVTALQGVTRNDDVLVGPGRVGEDRIRAGMGFKKRPIPDSEKPPAPWPDENGFLDLAKRVEPKSG